MLLIEGNETMPWLNAQTYCEVRGGYLAEVVDSNLQQALAVLKMGILEVCSTVQGESDLTPYQIINFWLKYTSKTCKLKQIQNLE